MARGDGTLHHSARHTIKSIKFPKNIPWDEFVIVTAADIPYENYIHHILKDHTCLADKEIKHNAEPILLLAHPDKQRLHAAVAAVEIEYESLPGVFTIEESEKMDPHHLGRGQHLQELSDGEGRCGLGLEGRRVHRGG